MRIEEIKIDDLVLSEKNPRSITKEEIENLCKNIEKDPTFIWQRPILVNEIGGKYLVYAGTQRVRAAKKLGWKLIPCSIEEDLAEELMNFRLLIDNQHNGEWDWDILGNNWEAEDLIFAGFDEKEVLDEFVDEKTEDKKPKKKKECPSCGYIYE